MATPELPPKYDSSSVESKWYSIWESKGFFRPRSDQTKDKRPKTKDSEKILENKSSVFGLRSLVSDTYVIVIPPPNVTGILHMGHALNNTIQDILIRWNRMRGKDTLWVPGVDHAGIATQNVVEKKLAKEKKTRQELGREKFLEEVWKWKEEHGSTITRQLRRLGASCDWTRERFTMDEGLSKAVRECFVTLYERGLIYQGNYIINCCPRCQTALSDEEAEHKEVQGALYYIRYPILKDPRELSKKDTILAASPELDKDSIVVATTRPETMLGDTAVAVNPEDPRYKHLHGKKLLLPLLNREIPVITDAFVDPKFGTGAVKVTPAHDPNDFEMGLRHSLAQINVLHSNGKINENGGKYQGFDRFEARKQIIADLKEQGLFEKEEKHSHAVGHCYRCQTIVEPYLSKQWFVKMKPLAEKALKAHREGKTSFYPDRWTKVYTNWLEGIRDWCISRQIWWGHQIPVWYCKKCQTKDQRPKTKDQEKTLEDESSVFGLQSSVSKGIIVSRDTPSKCPHCGSTELKQDPDVLDTWFSSWLWPFSTLGWPEKTPDLEHFYPTSDLITAAEIIFFWVARMIMAGLEFMGEVPFSRIYIHGTVRAEGGLKMSKSLGNIINPLEIIDEMGADALRFSMMMLSAQDVYLSREKFEVGRNFTNKLWNASRFLLMNLEGFPFARAEKIVRGQDRLKDQPLSLPSRWILSRLTEVARRVDQHLSKFELAQASSELYHFVWNDFCDWYIELSKPTLSQGADKIQTQAVLFYVLKQSLSLLHPFIPFITEEIWQTLKEIGKLQKEWPESIMLARWPSEAMTFSDPEAEASIANLQKAVSGIRDLRTRVNLPPSQAVDAVVVSKNEKLLETFRSFESQMKKLGRLESLEMLSSFQKSKSYLGNAFPEFEVFIKIEGLVDFAEESKRIQKKIGEIQNYIASIQRKLANENFVRNAPAEIVDQERTKLADAGKVLKSHEELLQLCQSA